MIGPEPQPISLGVRSNPAASSAAGVARLINCYADVAGEEGVAKHPLYACDGFELFATTFTGTGVEGGPRASFAFSETVGYIVVGTRVAKLTVAGTYPNLTGSYTLLTGSVSGEGFVTMARNRKEDGAQIGLVTSDGHFYIIENDTLTEITLPVDAPTINSIGGLDGYFLLTDILGEFYITSIDEGAEIDDLDFAAAESNPDSTLRVMVRGREAIFFGPESTEFWDNTAAADFPFERTAAKSYGIYAPMSAANILALIDETALEDSIIWAGTDKSGAYAGVMLMAGYDATKISPSGLDEAILDEPDVDSIRGFVTNRRGEPVYTITGSTFTWEYHTTTGFWNERKSSGLDRWRIDGAMTLAKIQLVTDYELSRIYWMKPGLYDASNPCILTLEHSNDNANTFPVARTRTISGAANKRQEIRFNKLGQSKKDGKVFRITLSHAVIENGTAVSMIVQPPAVNAWPKRLRFYGLDIDVTAGVSQTAEVKGITRLAFRGIPLAS